MKMMTIRTMRMMKATTVMRGNRFMHYVNTPACSRALETLMQQIKFFSVHLNSTQWMCTHYVITPYFCIGVEENFSEPKVFFAGEIPQ